jgi:hypothetical protein
MIDSATTRKDMQNTSKLKPGSRLMAGSMALKTFLENTGLYNELNNKHGWENVPPTTEPCSKVIDYVFVSKGLVPHIAAIVQDTILQVTTGYSSWTSMLNPTSATKRAQCGQKNGINYNFMIQG